MFKLNVEEKIIAYFDILGYKRTIKEIDDENKFLNVVKNVFTLTKLEKLQNANFENDLSIQTFSDNIFICANKNNNPDYLDNFLLMMSKIQHNLIVENGIFVRGCVTVGNVYIDNEIVYGTGLVDAVIGEEMATWPVIEIDEKFMSLYNKKSNISKLILDFNDKHYLNFFYYDVSDKNSIKGLLNIKNRIVENTKKYAKITNNIKQESTVIEREKVIKKYMWLITFFNSNVDEKYKIKYQLEINPKFNIVELKII